MNLSTTRALVAAVLAGAANVAVVLGVDAEPVQAAVLGVFDSVVVAVAAISVVVDQVD